MCLEYSYDFSFRFVLQIVIISLALAFLVSAANGKQIQIQIYPVAIFLEGAIVYRMRNSFTQVLIRCELPPTPVLGRWDSLQIYPLVTDGYSSLFTL